MTRGHVLNPIAQAELQAFSDQLTLLHRYKICLATCNFLDEITANQIQTQYEAENLIEEYDDFKNKD